MNPRVLFDVCWMFKFTLEGGESVSTAADIMNDVSTDLLQTEAAFQGISRSPISDRFARFVEGFRAWPNAGGSLH